MNRKKHQKYFFDTFFSLLNFLPDGIQCHCEVVLIYYISSANGTDLDRALYSTHQSKLSQKLLKDASSGRQYQK